jgi:hypothetical protein
MNVLSKRVKNKKDRAYGHSGFMYYSQTMLILFFIIRYCSLYVYMNVCFKHLKN